jgi:hypothetical protein
VTGLGLLPVSYWAAGLAAQHVAMVMLGLALVVRSRWVAEYILSHPFGGQQNPRSLAFFGGWEGARFFNQMICRIVGASFFAVGLSRLLG